MGRPRKTTEQFIEQAMLKHGNKFDYSKTVYEGPDKKVCVICPEHGEFYQNPSQHIRSSRTYGGHGCPKCARLASASTRKFSLYDFIKKARSVHGDKFDYSKVSYVNSRTYIYVTCPHHGQFSIKPNNHIQGLGCARCSWEHFASNAAKTTEQFITDAKKIHGDKYDYSRADYSGVFKEIHIICPEHGGYLQTAATHLGGSGCKECAKEKNAKRQIENRKTTEQFIYEAKKIHGDKYNYENTNYITALKKICIICPEHGEFLQLPNNHLRAGCPKCGELKNISEASTREAMENIFGINFPSSYPSWLKNPKTNRGLQLDGYNSQYNIAFEFQGLQHYESVPAWGGNDGLAIRRHRDKIKNNICLINDVILIKIDGREIPHKHRRSALLIKPYILKQLLTLQEYKKKKILERLKKNK